MPAVPAEKRACSFALGVGQQGRGPVLVGEAEPGVGRLVKRISFFSSTVLVALLLQALIAEHADEAFVQDVVAFGLRRAVARDQRIGDQRRPARRPCWSPRPCAVNRYLSSTAMVRRKSRPSPLSQVSVTGLPGASVPAPSWRHTVSASGSFAVDARAGHPAELGVERVLGAGRREQHDRGRLRVDGLAVLRQREVVDARAFERDRALQARRLDRRCAGSRRARRRACGPGRSARSGRRSAARPAGRAPGVPGAGRGVAGVPGAACRRRLLLLVAPAAVAAAPGAASPSAACRRRYCQPSSTIAESTIARSVFFLSVISVLSSRAPAPLARRVSARRRIRRRSARTALSSAARRPIST